jgi:type I restriction enzyme S subunit
LLSQDFTNYAIAGSARAGMPKVNREHLFAYRLNLPSIEKQRKVASILRKLFDSKSELNDIFNKQRLSIESLRNAILTQALQPPQQ